MLFLLGVKLGFRGVMSIKNLEELGLICQLTLLGILMVSKCLQYTEDPSSKTPQGGVSMHPLVPKIVNVYPNFNNLERYPVR